MSDAPSYAAPVEVGAVMIGGTVKYREERIDGLENAPQAFFGLLKGDNFGKPVMLVGTNAKGKNENTDGFDLTR